MVLLLMVSAEAIPVPVLYIPYILTVPPNVDATPATVLLDMLHPAVVPVKDIPWKVGVVLPLREMELETEVLPIVFPVEEPIFTNPAPVTRIP